MSDLAADDRAASALDSYLSDLQAGRKAGKNTLLSSHPHLAELVQCLEDLDRLAEPEPARPDSAPTLPAESAVANARLPVFPDFGKYEVECELGRGGMGVVYKARQKDLDRPVALKMVLSGQLASQDQIARFHDEARFAAGLHHSNIVSIYEAGEICGQPYFAMQYIAGPSLASKLEHGPLAPEPAAQLVAVIARAVEHLHRHAIIHRDLKPSNILLDDDGIPFVTDFGLVKLLAQDSQRTRTGVIVGTPSYMAPEQAAARGQVGPLSDVYSLGAILYETLTGRPPFREETPLDTLAQVLEGEPPAPRQVNPSIPADLELICLRCLEKEPQRRYASAAALADDLERFLQGDAVEARPASVGQRLMRWVRREPSLAAHLITLGGCALIAQVAYQLSHFVPLSFHVLIISILAAWAAASFVCQVLLRREHLAQRMRYIWAALDVGFFTLVLYVDEALSSPLIIGYPLLIAASGLWFRVPLVWFTTASALLSYGVLAAAHWRDVVDLHKHVMFLVGLAVMGFVVAYQVQRVRALSRYYERRLP